MTNSERSEKVNDYASIIKKFAHDAFCNLSQEYTGILYHYTSFDSSHYNEIHGDCCFHATIAASIRAKVLCPLLAACFGLFFGGSTLDFGEWARFIIDEVVGLRRFLLRDNEKKSRPRGFDPARSWLIGSETTNRAAAFRA